MKLIIRLIVILPLFGQISFGFMDEIPIKLEPNIPKLTKKIVYDNLGKKLFATPAAGAGLVWEPTDTTFNGIFFVTDLNWNRIVFADMNSNWIKAYGSYGSGPGQFWQPQGIDIDRFGRVFVADSRNARIVQLQYDFNLDTLTYVAGIKTIGDIILDLPLGLCIDDNGTPEYYNDDCLFIADGGLNMIIKMKIADRSFIYKYGDVAISQQWFAYPRAVAKGQTNGANNSNLYIVDYLHQRVVLMHDYGDSVKWVTSKKISGRYNKLLSICTDFYGNVYVTDLDSCRVIKFDPELSTYQTFGSYGIGTNKFYNLFNFTVPRKSLNGFAIESWSDSSGIKQFRLGYGISGLEVQPDTFDATVESLLITIQISAPSRITLKVTDETTIVENQFYETGTHTFVWNGRGKNNKVVLPGIYRIIAEDYGSGGALWYDTKSAGVTVKGTIKSGVLAQNEHWTEEGEPYVLTGDVFVPGGGRLTIDPGVKVMPTGNYGILPRYQFPYWHHVYAQGTALNKILFTPHRKLYPVPDSIPKGFWKGIDFHTANWEDSLIFSHCIIEGAGSDSAAFWVYMAKYVNLSNCEISRSGGFGFYCDYRCNTVLVNNCQFTDNDSIPLVVPFEFIGEISGNSVVKGHGLECIM